MLRPEPTLVLSPLIALMKDQVDKLPPRVAPAATFVNSSLAADGDVASRLAEVAAGGSASSTSRPSGSGRRGSSRLLRGHRHRARRRRRGALREHVGARLPARLPLHPPRARGARRADPARDDGDRDARDRPADRRGARPSSPRSCLRASCGRTCATTSRRSRTPKTGCEILVDRLGRLDGGSAIVYARSRRSTEELARVLRGHGVRAEHYHAGLEARRADARPGRVRRRARRRPSSRRRRSAWGSTSPTCGSSASHNYPVVARGVRADGRPGGTRRARRATRSSSRARATPSSLRRFAVSDVPAPGELRAVYRALRDSGGDSRPRRARARSCPTAIRASSSGCSSRQGSCDAASTRAGGCGSSCSAVARRRDRARREPCSNALASSPSREPTAIVAFAESRRCRHGQVAEHFGEDLRAAVRRVRRLRAARDDAGGDREIVSSAPGRRRERRSSTPSPP